MANKVEVNILVPGSGVTCSECDELSYPVTLSTTGGGLLRTSRTSGFPAARS